MAYRIVYGPIPKVKNKGRSNLFRIQLMTAVFAFLFVVLVKAVCAEGVAVLRSFLIPGTPGTTAIAFSEMLTDIREGQTLTDSLTAFCRQVIDSAKVLN